MSHTLRHIAEQVRDANKKVQLLSHLSKTNILEKAVERVTCLD